MKMPHLLQAIRILLKKLNDQYCLRRSLIDEREGNKEDFKRNAKTSKTAYAFDHYTEFLDDAKVENEVPDGESDYSGKNGSDDVFMTIVRFGKMLTSSDNEIEVNDKKKKKKLLY